MRNNLLAIAICGLLLGADALADDAFKKELQKLQGTWVCDQDSDIEYKLVFQGDQMTMIISKKDGSRKEERKCKITIDPTKKPKEMDWLQVLAKDVELIYELDADRLKICSSNRAGRPKDFQNKLDDVQTFKRVKKE